MPLHKGKSRKDIGENIDMEEKRGKPYRQALAISLTESDEAKKRDKKERERYRREHETQLKEHEKKLKEHERMLMKHEKKHMKIENR